MAEEEDAELAAMARLRGEIIRLQSEQARRRETIRRQEQRHQALREELYSRKDEASKLANIIEFEASKLANTALQQQNVEAAQALEKQEALKKSCATLLDEFIPGVYSQAGEKLAARAAKLANAGSANADDDEGEKKEAFHDVVWITYIRPLTEDFNYQTTMKISKEAVVREILEDACEYWGCSVRDNSFYKGEKDPRPITQQRINMTSAIVAQRDPETKLTQKESLMQSLDPLGNCVAPTTLGLVDHIQVGDRFLGVLFAEEGKKMLTDAVSEVDGKPLTAEQLIARTAEDDQLIFQFDDSRRVAEVLPLTEIAHIYLVHDDEAPSWIQRVLSGKRRATPEQLRKQAAAEDVNPAATRAAEYPTCLEAVKAWPGLFVELTNAAQGTMKKNYMIKTFLRQTKCRDVIVYGFLFLFTLLSLFMSLEREKGFWAVEGLRRCLVDSRGASAVNEPLYPVSAASMRRRQLVEIGESGGEEQIIYSERDGQRHLRAGPADEEPQYQEGRALSSSSSSSVTADGRDDTPPAAGAPSAIPGPAPGTGAAKAGEVDQGRDQDLRHLPQHRTTPLRRVNELQELQPRSKDGPLSPYTTSSGSYLVQT